MVESTNESNSLDLTDGGQPGEPTTDTSTDVGSGTAPLDQPERSIDFPDGLDESITGDPSLKVFIQDNKLNYGNLIKSYVHAQKKMGEKGVQLPTEHSTDEDWANFYNMLRPSELEQYQLKAPENMALNEERFTAFRENAHKLGLQPKQAQAILDWYNTSISEETTAVTQQNQQAYEAEVKGLKEDWGEGFDKEMNLAQRAVKEFADEETVNYLKDSGLAGNVKLIKLFNKIGKGLLEDKFTEESHGTFGATKDEAQKKINTIMGDFSNPYYDSKHPNHNAVVEEVNKYYQILNA